MSGEENSGERDATAPTVLSGARARAPSRAPKRSPGHEPGTRYGRYILLEHLASGGMGHVYKAHDPVLDRAVALKLLRVEEHGGGTAARDRMLREAQALAKIAHPNVLTIFDVGVIDDEVFLATELLSGPSLKEWLAAETRTPREIAEVFEAAGAGLAAAHEAGIVHRDFKPANAVIGGDGRVRVVDFGLARTPEPEDVELADGSHSGLGEVPSLDVGLAMAGGGAVDGPASPPPRSADDTPSREASLLSSRLTRVGVVVGTPAYMAPELSVGAPATPASDQFAFGVSFYEALCGHPAFAGRPGRDLERNIAAGRVVPPSGARPVPRRMRAVAERAMTVNPDARFPSMEAMLASMRGSVASPRRALAVIVGLALVVAMGVVGIAGARRAPLCTGADGRWGEVWGADKRASLERALRETGSRFAGDAVDRVARGLDRYGQSWTRMYTDSCLATRERGEQSAALLDLRAACLEERRAAVRAALTTAASASIEGVAAVPELVAELPRVEDCADTERLLAEGAALPAEKDRGAVAALREELASARALEIAGRYREAIPLVNALLERARALQHGPTIADVLLLRAELDSWQAAYDRAETALRQTVREALATRHDHLAAEALIQLLWVTGEEQGERARAAAWGDDADAVVRRLGDPPELRGLLELRRGQLALRADDNDLSQRLYDKATPLIHRAYGRDSMLGAECEMGHGVLAIRRGEFDDASTHTEAALEIYERVLGPSHPYTLGAVNNLGMISEEKQRPGRARAYYRRALAAYEATYGAEHPRLAGPLVNLGMLAAQSGEYDVALPLMARAFSLREAGLGLGHPMTLRALSGLAALRRSRGEVKVARDLLARGLEVESSPEQERELRVALGSAELELGNARAAVAALRRALELAEAKGDPGEVADLQFALARALWAAKDRAAARRLAASARDALQGGDARARQRAGEISAWLAADGEPVQ